jgi:hypothetical protein
MPIGQSRRVGTGIFVDPNLISSLVKQKWFPQTCTFQSPKRQRDDAGSYSYVEPWPDVVGYEDLPCRKFDRLPHEDRTLEIIDELKFWTIALGGYYPNVKLEWRTKIVETGELFHVVGVDSDSLHLVTVVTCELFTPTVEPGI